MAQVSIPLSLSEDQAEALAQLVKRFGWDDAERLSDRFDGGRERDAMLEALRRLQNALAEASFAPR
jgi:hypothetical protein